LLLAGFPGHRIQGSQYFPLNQRESSVEAIADCGPGRSGFPTGIYLAMSAGAHIIRETDQEINILMVDDQPAKLLTYEAMLGELGQNLIKAHSGMEALEHLLKTDIALVLMDVSMPGMDGFETAQMIHDHPRFQNTPIVFISGIHMTDLDRLKGYQHGAVDYVSVPVIPELLRAKVKVFAELHRKTQQLEVLNAQITRLQDEERRRIARELHDSVGQLLAAIAMNSAVVDAESHKLSLDAARRLLENTAMVEEASKQIRTISHLLHPPLLDEAGLASALRWYVEGFSARSKIDTRLDIPQTFVGLSKEMELSIFRVVQECLTNIHRHAGSPMAGIRIMQDEACLRVEIEDAGKGIPPEKHAAFKASERSGVGLRGMRERLRLLGGGLHIQSNDRGTRVTAILPVARATSPVAQDISCRSV
jgi:signal transduction histidine kinase